MTGEMLFNFDFQPNDVAQTAYCLWVGLKPQLIRSG